MQSPNDYILLKESDKLRVKINSVEKDVGAGEIEAENGEDSKQNKIKGKFAAKIIAAASGK